MYVHRLRLIKCFLYKLDLNTLSYIWVTELVNYWLYSIWKANSTLWVVTRRNLFPIYYTVPPEPCLTPTGTLPIFGIIIHPSSSTSVLHSALILLRIPLHLQWHQVLTSFANEWSGNKTKLCTMWNTGRGKKTGEVERMEELRMIKDRSRMSDLICGGLEKINE